MIAWRLALRDLRRGGRGLLLLALCLFLGTAALAGIGSLSASIVAALAAQGRTILGGDVEMRVSQRRASVEESAAFTSTGRVSETVSMRAMASAEAHAGNGPVLVELRGVDAAWPLVGRLRLATGALDDRPRGAEIALAPVAAERLGVKPGDIIRLGTARLKLIGLIADEPDRLGASFTLGPPALVPLDALDATQLVQPGSLYESRYRIVLAHPDAAAATGKRLTDRFAAGGWSARTSDKAAATIRKAIEQLGQFLLLVGLAALAIAGVGVGSGVAAYLQGKTQMIAVLKVLGARSGMIAAVILAELGLVAGVGIGSGLVLGAAVPWIVGRVAGDALPVPPQLGLYAVPLATAAALGLLVALLFALPALARARAVPPATLLRGAVVGRRGPGLVVLAGMTVLTAAIVALAVLTASDTKLALEFVGAVAALIAGLWALGLLVRFVAARAPRPRAALVRLALANLHRPGAQTDRLVVALGLGFSLFVALAVIDTSLTAELAGAAPAKAPRFFAVDLQPEDARQFAALIAAASPGARIEAQPSLRGAITAVKNARVADMKAIPDSAWVLKGDRTLTWSAALPPRNTVVAGRWWPRDYRGAPLVSIEDRTAEALHVRVGDMLTVSVLGVEIPARIAALRRIDWGGFGLNFALVFSPGYIEEAPHSLLATVYSAPMRDALVARRVATRLPSVTMIRVGDVIGQIGALLGQLAVAIRAAAAVTVAAGVAVLVGAVAASGRARRYDAVILKLLGGSGRQVLAAQGIEYGLLSAILVGVSLAVGGGAGWYVVVHVLDLPWAPDWGVVAATLAAAVGVTLAVGVLGSVPALRGRPASVLRDS